MTIKEAPLPNDNEGNVEAPKVTNNKHKILWSNESIPNYQALLSKTLTHIQESFNNHKSKSSFSLLLQSTNEILTSASKETQKFIDLSVKKKPVKKPTPKDIIIASKDKKSAHKAMKSINEDPYSSSEMKSEARSRFVNYRKTYRSVCRKVNAKKSFERDVKLHSILTSNPSTAFKTLRKHKSSSNDEVNELHVENKVYHDDKIIDGFYENIKCLKTVDPTFSSCQSCDSFKYDYTILKEICQNGAKIPPLSLEQASKLLKSLKPAVCDHWSVSANHYIHGGPPALKHLQFVINAAIEDINNTEVEEMNTAHACVLYKGHSKSRNQAGSYKTISTCPFTSKAVDLYVRGLSIEEWDAAKADVQFLGPGMSHELGALLVTETINFTIQNNDKPVYALFLDARAAFDKTVREIMVRTLFLLGTDGHRLVYLDNRLKNRKTFVEWDLKVAGPINDELGVEQGGVSSGDLYKVYNNQQFQNLQESHLGIQVHGQEVAASGQADDAVLLSDDIHSLRFLLQLTLDFCKKNHITLAPEKTKLVAFYNSKQKDLVDYQTSSISIAIEGKEIKCTDTAEHVGIVRSNSGNLPHILDRVSSHRKALFSVLPAGLARHHSANPAASLRVNSMLALPVLLSGVASLLLITSELNVLSQHHKNILRSLLKLPDKTPEEVVYFVAGSLPAEALLNLRQLSLFCMIYRLSDNILHKMARQALMSENNRSKSWLVNIRKLCTLYDLPSPLSLLSSDMSKEDFKTHMKRKVTDFWERKLRKEASSKSSLEYFKPEFMSLLKPHPLLLSCHSNPWEVNKAIIQCRMLSGRYHTDWLTRHWSADNKSGACVLCPQESVPGTLEHLLIFCPALESKRLEIYTYWEENTVNNSCMNILLTKKRQSPTTELTQFLLDPSVDSDVICCVQNKLINLDEIFKLTRTFVYGLHRRRLKLLGKFNVL